MAQVKCFDKRVGITYVYESESYYDPEKHQSRSKRKLIGKIDPETGQIVPTSKRGRPRKEPDASPDTDAAYRKSCEEALERLAKAEARLSSMEREMEVLKESVKNYRAALGRIADICAENDG